MYAEYGTDNSNWENVLNDAVIDKFSTMIANLSHDEIEDCVHGGLQEIFYKELETILYSASNYENFNVNNKII